MEGLRRETPRKGSSSHAEARRLPSWPYRFLRGAQPVNHLSLHLFLIILSGVCRAGGEPRLSRAGDLPTSCSDGGCQLQMVDRLHGWLLTRSELYGTKDGGLTWMAVSPPTSLS